MVNQIMIPFILTYAVGMIMVLLLSIGRELISRKPLAWRDRVMRLTLSLKDGALYLLVYSGLVAALMFFNNWRTAGTARKGDLGLDFSLLVDWMPFLIAISILQIVAIGSVLYLRGRHARIESPPRDDADSDHLVLPVLSAVIVLILVPLYVQGIYPTIPQQMGGGKVIPVEIATSGKELNTTLSSPGSATYLIDRSPSRFLIFLVDDEKKTGRVIEIANTSIESVVYRPELKNEIGVKRINGENRRK